MTAVTAFGPIVGRVPQVLILGSLPGVASLRAGRYYAHPRNTFWVIMAELFGTPVTASYRARVAILKRNRVAVWDVLREAHRPGSADTAIDIETALPNPFAEFLRARPSIRCVFFNGGKAAVLYRRKVQCALPVELGYLRYLVLPSTSPAHASLDLRAKLRHWSILKQELEQ